MARKPRDEERSAAEQASHDHQAQQAQEGLGGKEREHRWMPRAPVHVGGDARSADRCFFCGATRIRMGSKFGDDGREVVEYAYRVPGVVDPMDGKKGPSVRVEREPKCPGVPRWGGG